MIDDQLTTPLQTDSELNLQGLGTYDEEGIPVRVPGNRNNTNVCKPWHLKDKDTVIHFVPAVLCWVVKSIGNVSLPEMRVSLQFTMILKFDCSALSSSQQEYLADNIRFRVDERDIDSKESIKVVPRGKILFCTYRSTEEQFYFCPDLSKLPFDKPLLSLKFDLSTVENKEEKESYRFNCVLVKEILGNDGILSFRDNCDRIPEYNLALTAIEIERPAEGKADPVTSEWNYVHYPTMIIHIPLYREPENLIFTVVMPLVILNLFTLTVFLLEGTDFVSKLSILVTIILAVFAFTFVVRSILPQVPYITDLEKQILISLIVLLISGIGSVVEYLTSEDVSLYAKYITGAIDTAVVVISVIVFCFQYFFYKKECNEADRTNDEYFEKQKVKIAGTRPGFKFTDCIGPGLIYSSKPTTTKKKKH